MPGTSGSFGALDGKVASFCSEGDLTCSAPENIALLQLAANVGRQINVDNLERDGLTEATGADVATVVGQIALKAFADIASQPNWMASDETFLEVLIKVSDPAYKPAVQTVAAGTDELKPNQIIDLAYLPQKIRNEIIGFIQTNQNTIQVAMNDPYQQTLGEGTGHHFDYWRDSSGNQPMTSAEYAAAWLTHLAEEADKEKAAKAATAQSPTVLLASADTEGSATSTAATSTTTTESPAKPATAKVAGTKTSASATTTTSKAAATATTTGTATASSTTRLVDHRPRPRRPTRRCTR